MRDNQREECEKRLKELEELIEQEELQVEVKLSTCGQFHWLIVCTQDCGYCGCVQVNYILAIKSQCFDTVCWMTGRTFGLYNSHRVLFGIPA